MEKITKNLYEVAFYTYFGSEILDYYGTRTSKTYIIKVNILSVIMNKIFGWLWKGLEESRQKLKLDSYCRTSELIIKANKLANVKKDSKAIKREQKFLERWKQLQVEEM